MYVREVCVYACCAPSPFSWPAGVEVLKRELFTLHAPAFPLQTTKPKRRLATFLPTVATASS